MLPADGVLRAAQRWLHLLALSTPPQASALIRADAGYTDLSPTQYAAAFEWLKDVGLLENSPPGVRLAPAARGLPDAEIHQLLFTRSLEALAPAWLPDADVLVPNSSELPQDAAELAAIFGLGDAAAMLAVRQVHGRIDLAERARIGAAGESGLVALLEQRWPGSTVHVALNDDGLGYDIVLMLSQGAWHLEVKTTGRRGRLVLYLSRHEHEVALADPDWRLVVVGLSDDGKPAALATGRHEALQNRAPYDRHSAARWESTRHQLGPADLQPGLPFLGAPPSLTDAGSLLYCGSVGTGSPYAWMPTGS